MNHKIMDPLEYYNTSGTADLQKNAVELFDGLLAKSGIDEEANRAAVEAYENAHAQCEQDRDARNRYGFYAFWAFFMIGGGVVFICMFEKSWWFVLLGAVLCALGGVWFGCRLHPALKIRNERLQESKAREQELLQQASAQLEPLEQQFGPRDGLELIQKTVPELVFHDIFTREHYDALRSFDFRDDENMDASVIRSLTGTLNGNPFAFLERLTYVMRTTTYTNTETIYWTEEHVERDSDGNKVVTTIQRSQDLTAEKDADKPCFSTYTNLGYGHQAAPELSFSRKPGKVHRFSAGWLDGKVRRGKRELERQSRRALQKGQDFLPMANEEFEVLFGATDRNNEHQFRQMFTPMAQRSMTDLLKDGKLVGDTFTFHKKRRLNVLSCSDAVFRESPRKYHDYSVQKAREAFVKHQEEYFRLIFGTFAPLLAIPLYREKSAMEPAHVSLGHFSPCEHETMVNLLPRKLLVTKDCKTQAILKTKLLSSTEQGDLIRVRAFGFAIQGHTKTVVFHNCGDGYTHSVDVDWDEYLPRTKSTTVLVGRVPEADAALPQQPGTVFYHGLFAKIMENQEEV